MLERIKVAVRTASVPTSGRVVFACVAAFLLAQARMPDVFHHPSFWAEDGAFFTEARLLGLPSILRPYSGYIHLVPRLVALSSMLLSAVVAPTFFVICAICITLWTVGTVTAAEPRHGLLFGVAILLVPASGEIMGTPTNLQWLMGLALALILVTPSPTTFVGRCNQAAFVVLSGLSGPFSAFALPIALWRLYRERDPHSRLIGILAVGAGLIQLRSLGGGVVEDIVPRQPLHLALAILNRTIAEVVAGRTITTGLDAAAVAAMLGLVVAAAVYERRLMLGLYAFVGVVVLSTWYKFLGFSVAFDGLANGDRYFYVPRLALLWAMVVVALRGWPQFVIVMVLVGVIATHFVAWTRTPLYDLPWRSEAWKIDQGLPVSIRINPAAPDDPPGTGWAVTLPARP